VEDLLGAAAVIDGLAQQGVRPSVEAAVALAALAAVPDVPAAISGCVSGQELITRGYGDDVAVAVELNVSRVVPALRSGAFVDAGASLRDLD
jgi:2-phosphosulfolactate phosphatase